VVWKWPAEDERQQKREGPPKKPRSCCRGPGKSPRLGDQETPRADDATRVLRWREAKTSRKRAAIETGFAEGKKN